MSAAAGRPIETRLFINNEFVPSVSGKTFDTVNPATGEVMAKMSEADAADIDAAVAAAKAAFARGSAWRTMDASQRGRLLNKLADAIERDREYFARLDSMDNGKPYSDALNIDVALVIKCCESGAAKRVRADTGVARARAPTNLGPAPTDPPCLNIHSPLLRRMV